MQLLNIMNQEIARKLMVDGATFVFLNVPSGTEFGIDMKSWTTGENFRGVKMIPTGLHYIFYSSVDPKTADIAPRIGFFYNFKKGEFVVRKWNVSEEVMSEEIVSERDVCGLKQNITLLDNFLGSYPHDIYERWKAMTVHVTAELCEKLAPLTGQIRSALELINEDSRNKSDIDIASTSNRRMKWMRPKDEEKLLPNLKPIEGTQIRFSTFPLKPYPDGCTPTEVTQHCLDHTYSLDQIIADYKQPMDVIGEIEYCYVCFLVGHSLEAFEQWKKLITLLCSCQCAIKKYRYIYDALISLLEIEIGEIPEEFLADIVTNNNFLYTKLRQLFATVQSDANIEGRLKSKMMRFQELLTDTYGWDFTHLESDEEDERPVIVEM